MEKITAFLVGISKNSNFIPLSIFIIACLIYTTNLGGQGLSLDEAETIVTGNTISIYGVPASWDGENIINISGGIEFKIINGVYVWRWHPWMHHYLSFVGQIILGESPSGARMPFAFFGAGSALVLYIVSYHTFKSKLIACLIAIQLIFLLAFFLYSRQVRYYAPSAFFALTTFYFLVMMVKDRWKKNYRIPLFVSTILLFLTNYITWGSSAVVLGIFALYKRRIDVVVILFINLLLALLWLAILTPFNGNIFFQSSMAEYPLKILSFASYINYYIFPFILLPFLFLLKKERWTLFVVGFYLLVKILFYGIFYFVDGRYLVDLFPILVFLYGYFYKAMINKSRFLLLGFFLILLTTNLLNLLPTILSKEGAEKVRFWPKEFYIELFEKYENPLIPITEYMAKNYQEGDLFYSSTAPFDIYYHSKVPYFSNNCADPNYTKLIPDKNRNIEKLRWIVLINHPPRLDRISNINCYGLTWDDLLKNYKRVRFVNNKGYSLNNPDVAIRHFPPYEVDLNDYIVVYEKKNRNLIIP